MPSAAPRCFLALAFALLLALLARLAPSLQRAALSRSQFALKAEAGLGRAAPVTLGACALDLAVHLDIVQTNRAIEPLAPTRDQAEKQAEASLVLWPEVIGLLLSSARLDASKLQRRVGHQAEEGKRIERVLLRVFLCIGLALFFVMLVVVKLQFATRPQARGLR
jgi:hypothetical protein